MSGWQAKRFWSEVTVARGPEGHSVLLDGKPIRTPARAPLILPTRALADLVAAEWAAQQGAIRPETMPATRSANAAIDKVRGQQSEVAALVAAYGATDLLCYRAEGPAALVARQAAAWDPLLDWAARRYGVALAVTAGVMPAPQQPGALARLAAEVVALDPFRLTALHDLVALPGSLVIGLAAADGAFDPAELWLAARIDEQWQIDQWGPDPEAQAATAGRELAFFQADRFNRACLTTDPLEPMA
jgi:chaperone required for assembly of F1-ATPase